LAVEVGDRHQACGTVLTAEQRPINALHSTTRALAERGPWRICAITAAALVLLHLEHDRAT
jgi:hypothetical protein